MHQKPPSLAEITAGRLQSHLGTWPDRRLPTTAHLARHYGVSLVTMHNALKLLRDKGLLQFRRGTGILIRSQDEAIDNPPLSPVTRIRARVLYETIRARIQDGTYPLHRPLPKNRSFAIEEKVSGLTVCTALRMLEREGMAHKSGKRWYAGPGRTRTPFTAASLDPPVIIILQPREDSWRNLHDSHAFTRFATAFEDEAQRYGIALTTILARMDAAIEIADVLPWGEDAAQALIKSLGKRYVGALLVGVKEEMPGMAAWLDFFLRFDRPVVVFDRLNEYEEIFTGRRGAFRCFPDEHGAVRTLFAGLHALGHRRIAIPSFMYTEKWMLRRRETMRRVLWEQFDDMEMLEETEREMFWENRSDGELPFQVLRRLSRSGIAPIRAIIAKLLHSNPGFFDHPMLGDPAVPFFNPGSPMPYIDNAMLWCTPVLTPLLVRNATALVAPGDVYARFFYYWLYTAGIDMPKKVSLVSMDSLEETRGFRDRIQISPLPISSIDPGFTMLGSTAFHALLRDIPVPHDRQGNIAARAQLVQRGSLGKARKGALGVDLRGELR
jgi:DNA-binding transcriptional regulator YhcF (GntR family)/DNA-binding LacI/PurR family transcriptional regulator